MSPRCHSEAPSSKMGARRGKRCLLKVRSFNSPTRFTDRVEDGDTDAYVPPWIHLIREAIIRSSDDDEMISIVDAWQEYEARLGYPSV
jgi:hypothetical protein